MSQVNLLPPEIRQRQATRRLTALVALAGVAVVAVMGFLFLLESVSLSHANRDLAAQQAVNNHKQAEIASLSSFAQLQTEVQNKRKLVDTVFANEVAWSGVLLDVSRIIPKPAYLTNVTGSVNVPTGTGPAPVIGQSSSLVGHISFQGFAVDVRTVAMWLTHLEQVKGWVNPWLTSATESAPGSKDYQFASGIDLTKAAVTKRGGGGQQ